MFNHNKAQQSKNRVHISWDILYMVLWFMVCGLLQNEYENEKDDDTDDDDNGMVWYMTW